MDTQIPKYHTIGSKYDPDLSLKEIAKRIRADILAARKAGLPVARVSVRGRQWSGAAAITIEVKDLAPTCGELYSTIAAATELENPAATVRCDHWTPIRRRIDDTLMAIANAYNYNDGDTTGFGITLVWDYTLLSYHRACPAP